MLKALSLTEPYASLVVIGEKENETRSWQTHYRGLIAIQAAKNFPAWAKGLLRVSIFKETLAAHGFYSPQDFTLGAIIGTVEIVEMIRTDVILKSPTFSEKEDLFGDYSPNRWAWRLANPKKLKTPILCKGALSLWEVPADVERQILEQTV